jgi:hypothetical protein
MRRRPGHRLRAWLYWADGRVEEPRQTLDVAAQPPIARRTEEGRHLPFGFTGVIDADGFACTRSRLSLAPMNP